MKSRANYNDAEKRLDLSLGILKNNLEYLQENIDNPKLIKRQTLIIESIEQFIIQSQSYISDLELEVQTLSSSRLNQINHLKENIHILEAICFIHGITDLSEWIRKSPDLLIAQAKTSIDQGEHFIPKFHLAKISKALKSEKEIIDKVMYRDYYFALIKNLQTIEELKKKRK